jgi:hypothetical protein
MVDSDRDKALAKALSEQKRLVAGDLFAEAWETGIKAGIEPELLAESLVRNAIGQLSRACGRAASEKLAAKLADLDSEGRLPQPSMLH